MTFGTMFHHFHDEKHQHSQGSIDSNEFESIILHLKKHYHLLTALEYYEKFLAGTLQAEHICLTFDDGLLSQWDVAVPILRKFNLTAFWFVYSSIFQGNIENLEIYRYFRHAYFSSIQQFYALFFQTVDPDNTFHPENYLSEFSFYTNEDRKFRYIRDMVLKKEHYEIHMDNIMLQYGADKKTIAANLWLQDDHLTSLTKQGHIIGAHSHTHPTQLNKLSLESQLYEYVKNSEHITYVTGIKPTCMAHPCNSYNDNTIDILHQLGFKLGFRSNKNKKIFSSLEYPREDHINLLQMVSQ